MGLGVGVGFEFGFDVEVVRELRNARDGIGRLAGWREDV